MVLIPRRGHRRTHYHDQGECPIRGRLVNPRETKLRHAKERGLDRCKVCAGLEAKKLMEAATRQGPAARMGTGLEAAGPTEVSP